MNDTLLRQWAMLRQIPRHPRRIDAHTMKVRLENQGMEVSLRTIQRDLHKMATAFPIQGDQSKPQGWGWREGAGQFDIPSMDPHTALTFNLVEMYLQKLLPPTTLKHLQPWFQVAQGVSDAQASTVSKWRDKLRIIPHSQHMIAPRIDSGIQASIYDGLLQERQLEITYAAITKGERKTYAVHPLALVVREHVVYLVCTVKDYPEPRYLALHRISAAKLLDLNAKKPKGFKLDVYLASGQLGIQVGNKPLKLVMKVRPLVARYLAETPISTDQVIEDCEPDWKRLRATVLDTVQIRSWLRSLGADAVVEKPAALAEELRSEAMEIAAQYAGR